MNVYKPRYKIAFQAKSKIWPYKDSRLRRFFNIRGRKLVRRGFFKRYVVVFNNMKWTIARRYIRPYMRRRKAVRRRFRNAFYTKQQLRAFHGKIKEEKFRNFFRKYLTHGVNRNMSFFAALERRLDIFLFRMRLLPTIFACHQYIMHHGVILNKGIERCPSAVVRPGDTLTISAAHWKALYYYLQERIMYRVYGKQRMLRRKYTKLKKKTWWTRSVLRASSLVFYIWRKRRYLDIFLIERRKRFLKLFRTLYKQFHFLLRLDDPEYVKKNATLIENLWLIHAQFSRLYAKYKKFNYLEKIRRKFFYAQWFKFKSKFAKVSNLGKQKKINSNELKSLSLRTRNKQMYTHFIYLLKSISSTYLNWLSLMLQLRLEELNYYNLLFISLKEHDIQTKVNFNKIIKQRKKFLILQSAYIRKNIITYYQLFFRRFFRFETRKSFYKQVSVQPDLKKPPVTKRVANGNILTYFLMRRRFRIRRSKRIPRLKQVHWAIPRYIHFDVRTLRAVFLYSPDAHEIHYSFKCSLPKIVSFYKSLAL